MTAKFVADKVSELFTARLDRDAKVIVAIEIIGMMAGESWPSERKALRNLNGSRHRKISSAGDAMMNLEHGRSGYGSGSMPAFVQLAIDDLTAHARDDWQALISDRGDS